jgi:hypothetical protein
MEAPEAPLMDTRRARAMRDVLGAALLFAAISPGCGETEADPSTDPASCEASQAVLQFASEIARAFCEEHQQCCSTAGYAAPSNCESIFLTESLRELVPAECAGGKLVPAVASECIRAYRVYASACGGNDGSGDPKRASEELSAACRGVVMGTSGLGEPCENSLFCAPAPDTEVSCVQYGYDDFQTTWCMHDKRVGLGESCKSAPRSPYDVKCEEGLNCSLDRICIEPRPLGSRCDHWKECAQGSDCVDGECVALLALGAPCTPGTGPGCTGLSFCTEAGVCGYGSALGDACREHTECASGSCVDGRCAPGNVIAYLFRLHCE